MAHAFLTVSRQIVRLADTVAQAGLLAMLVLVAIAGLLLVAAVAVFVWVFCLPTRILDTLARRYARRPH